jgi:hypothetical protein
VTVAALSFSIDEQADKHQGCPKGENEENEYQSKDYRLIAHRGDVLE